MHQMPNVCWYVVVTEPGMDVRFAGDLAERGYETFLPWIFKREKVGNQAWVRAELRFPGYVWVCLDKALRQDFETVKQTLGFARAVSLRLDDEGQRSPSEVPSASIKGMRRDQVQDFEAAVRRVRRKESMFHVDDVIRVVDREHLFHGYTGTVKSARHGSLVAELGPFRMPVHFEESEVALATSMAERKMIAG